MVQENGRQYFEQIKTTDTIIQRLQTQISNGINNPSIREKLERMKDKREALMPFEHKFFKQRAKINHIKFNDKNTKYFHLSKKLKPSRTGPLSFKMKLATSSTNNPI